MNEVEEVHLIPVMSHRGGANPRTEILARMGSMVPEAVRLRARWDAEELARRLTEQEAISRGVAVITPDE